MKKTTAFFVSIAVIAIIVGGIGSATYFRKAEKEASTTKQEHYAIKDKNSVKEVHVTLSGNADVYLYSDESDQVLLNTKSSFSTALTSSLQVKEENNRLAVQVTGNEKNSPSDRLGLSVDMFDRGSSVALSLPTGMEKLVIDGDATGSIHLSSISVDELVSTIDHANILLNTTKTNQLSLTTLSGDLSATFDTKSEKASFTTSSGNISTDDFSAANWSATSTEGDISLTNPKGVYTIESKNGNINALSPKGQPLFKTINGDISLTINDLPKGLEAHSQNGNISMFTEEILYNTSIQAKTKLGDSMIFDQSRTSYKQGKGTVPFVLTSNAGDISVEGPFDYEEGTND